MYSVSIANPYAHVNRYTESTPLTGAYPLDSINSRSMQ